MTLKSAFEDLIGTTLAAVAGLIGKLEYVSGLRRATGEPYSHWGLTRVYGETASQQALAEAHRLLFLKLLRSSLRNLQDDVVVSSESLQVTPKQYVDHLRNHSPELLPKDLGGGSERHFNSVLLALSSLTKTRPHANPRA